MDERHGGESSEEDVHEEPSMASEDDWETILKPREAYKSQFLPPSFYVSDPSMMTLYSSSRALQVKDYVENKTRDIDEILANSWQRYKDKMVFTKPPAQYPMHPHTPRPTPVPQDIVFPVGADEREILSNLEEFYLNPADVHAMPRREELLLYNCPNREVVGKMSICTEQSAGKLLVQMEGIKSDQEIKKTEAYSLFGWATTQYIAVKEFRTEQSWMPNFETFRSLHILRLDDSGFHVSAKHGSEGAETNEVYFMPMKKMKRVISEVAIFLLMRKMVSSQFIGTIKLRCLYLSGDICLTNLRCYRPTRMLLNNVAVDVVRIRRKILCPHGIEQISNTFITTAGQFVAQVFKNDDIRIQIDPASVLHPYFFVKPERLVPLRSRYKQDPQVYSFYLDEIDKWTYKNKLYLHDHEEVFQVLSHLMKELLFNKPHRVIAFAQHYFTSLL